MMSERGQLTEAQKLSEALHLIKAAINDINKAILEADKLRRRLKDAVEDIYEAIDTEDE